MPKPRIGNWRADLHAAIVRGAKALGFAIDRYPSRTSLSYLIRQILGEFAVTCVVDVGAHVGEYGSMLRQEADFRGTILSIEPSSIAYSKLTDRAAGDPHWLTSQYALSSSSGAGSLFDHGGQFTSLHQMTEFGRSRYPWAPIASERVICKRLEDLRGEFAALGGDARLLIKIDTQGHDLYVLQGVGELLRQTVAVQCELSLVPLYEEGLSFATALNWFNDAGFALAGLFPVAIEPGGYRLVELDALWIRSGDPA